MTQISQVRMTELPGYVKMMHDLAITGNGDDAAVAESGRTVVKFVITEMDELQIPDLEGVQDVFLIYRAREEV